MKQNKFLMNLLLILTIVLLVIIIIILYTRDYEHMTIDNKICDNGERNIKPADKIVYPRKIPDAGIPSGNLNIVDYDGKDIMTPLSLPMVDDVPFIYLEGKPYVDPNVVLNIKEWKSLISKINMKIPYEYKDKYSKDEVKAMVTNSYSDIMKTMNSVNNNMVDYGFIEEDGIKYNYFNGIKRNIINFEWVINMRDRVMKDIEDQFNQVSFKIAQCQSSYNPCKLEIVDWRIIKLGRGRNNGNKAMEGQILIGVKERPQLILIRYIVSDEGGYRLYTIYVEGFSNRSERMYENQEKKLCNEGNIIPNPNPIIKTDKILDISMNEPQIVKPRSELIGVVDNVLQKFYDMNEPKCYGKLAATKNECESIYDPAGRPNKVIGVWDKECRKDSECPFYKANKNYPNNFGRCIDGKCEMPYGIKQVSPFKYREEDKAVCYRCKNNDLNCCEEQKDRNKYGDMKSPDYKFEGDELLRLQYYYMLE
jgi:hypothetical protein